MQNLYIGSLAFCALFLLTLGSGREGKLSRNGVHVQGLGKSGKLRIGRMQRLENDSNAMIIDFDSIQEVDSSGAPISGQGSRRHRFNTFANQEFNITGPTNVTVYGLQATRIGFESSLSTGSELALQVFIFREEGNVTVDDEVTPVQPGTVKFNILLSNWTFCGESDGVFCGGKIGRYLDLTLRILGRKPPKRRTQPRPPPGRSPRKRSRGQEFEMGGNVTISFSKKVFIDSMVQSEDMPGDFPIYETRGVKQLFHFRFRRFNTSVMYDPVVNTDDAEVLSSPDNGTHLLAPSVLAMLIMCILQLLR